MIIKASSRRTGIDLRKQIKEFGVDSLLPDWKPPKGVKEIPAKRVVIRDKKKKR